MAEDSKDWLTRLLQSVGGVAGTIHAREGDGLRLVAAVNIPEFVQKTIDFVPNGKGMAGIALDTKRPVQTCNLKDDTSGQVRPGAKAVSAKAAVAMPIADAHGAVVAVVGVAFNDEREIPDQEVRELMQAAAPVVSFLSQRTS